MFAVLHLADFALQAVLRHESAVSHRPAALFATDTKKSLVLSLNAPARAAGVELGMTAPQAVARCATLLIRSRHPAAEAETRAALIAVGFTLSPSVEDTAPGVCTVDLKGFDSEKLSSAAVAAVAELARLGLTATCGLATTPLLALYAARATTQTRSRSPTPTRSLNLSPSLESSPNERTSKIKRKRKRTSQSQNHSESEIQRTTDNEPCSVLHITDPAAFLAPLPLSTADPSPELASVLFHWGLRTLGDLTALPRDEIVRRFGAAGLALWQRATGGSPRPLHPVALPHTFFAGMEFEEALETLEPLLFILRRFLDRLTLELRAAQLATAEIALTLSLADDTEHARAFRLPEPTADAEILFRTVHTHLESLQTAASISALRLRLVPTRPLIRQEGLFESGLRDPHGFAETLARAMAILGSDRVGTPQLADSHRPDAFTLAPPASVISAAAPAPLHPPLGLPLRRYRPPLPARLEFTEGRATYLWTDQMHGEISFRLGPWPRSGDWWQPDRAWDRTEWDLALTGGGLYRLLRLGEAYFIEGEYD